MLDSISVDGGCLTVDGLAKGVVFAPMVLNWGDTLEEMVLKRLFGYGFGRGLTVLVGFLDVGGSLLPMLKLGKCYVL